MDWYEANRYAMDKRVPQISATSRSTSDTLMDPLLRVRDLTVHFPGKVGPAAQVVRGVGFEIRSGEVIALLGESGCGKTSIALALLGLHSPSLTQVKGSIEFQGKELLRLSGREMQEVRGAQISMISQEPGIALNPVIPAGVQIGEVIRAHERSTRRIRRERVEELLADVGFSDTARIYAAYPHQLSGGQKQRVVIAQSLACKPALVVADEPTASLDGPAQAEILALLKDLKDQIGIALLFITHNPRALIGFVDRVLVMYAGRIVEEGSTEQILRAPIHPYTKGLLAALPKNWDVSSTTRSKYLPVIAGNPPNPAQLPGCCAFVSRCPEREEICSAADPRFLHGRDMRSVECFVHGS